MIVIVLLCLLFVVSSTITMGRFYPRQWRIMFSTASYLHAIYHLQLGSWLCLIFEFCLELVPFLLSSFLNYIFFVLVTLRPFLLFHKGLGGTMPIEWRFAYFALLF